MNQHVAKHIGADGKPFPAVFPLANKRLLPRVRVHVNTQPGGTVEHFMADGATSIFLEMVDLLFEMVLGLSATAGEPEGGMTTLCRSPGTRPPG